MFEDRAHFSNPGSPIFIASPTTSSANIPRTAQSTAAFHALVFASRHAPSTVSYTHLILSNVAIMSVCRAGG